MRTTLNISDEVIREAEALYGYENRSRAVENALKDAIRIKKLEKFKNLKGRIHIDEDAVNKFRSEDR
jgi:Arc/MetJ family transcription regulator